MNFRGLKNLSLLLGILCVSAANAFSAPPAEEKDADWRAVSLTHRGLLEFARRQIALGEYENAREVLLIQPYKVRELEIERLYLLARIETLTHNEDEAVRIYLLILDHAPNIANIRFRLAELYLRQKSWWRADYHYRLALADKNTPPIIQARIRQALSEIRQNKNWNVRFNFGLAPDSNVNNTGAGEQCVMTIFGIMCNTLDNPKKDVGYNLTLGGDYEFRLSDNWRLRNEASVYNSTYEDKAYNDVYLAYTVGGRYIYKRGDIFFGPTVSRRYIGNKPYNYSFGLKLATTYDITPRLNAKLTLHETPTYYDDYAQTLNGDVKGAQMRLFYTLDSSKYLIFKGSYEYEETKNATYTNDRIGYGVGFGAELPWGFHFYAEPSVQYTHYKDKRWTVKDYQFVQLKEHNTTAKYLVSLSNRKLSFWDIVPTLSYTYIDKSSNILHRSYDKSVIELSFSKGF